VKVKELPKRRLTGLSPPLKRLYHELAHFVIGMDPRRVNAVANAVISPHLLA
jgi:hypothetical protein